MGESHFYIDFEIIENNRQGKLDTFFEKIKEEKDKFFETEVMPSTEIEDWNKYLDDKAKNWFNKIELKPNSEKLKVYTKLWELTEPKIRLKHPIFNTEDNWNLDSMLHTIFEGAYELIKIERKENKGKLIYEPFSSPFGGTESLVQLIESFGNKVTYDYWHDGPHLRPKVGWDFELAKKLVSEGKGIELVEKSR